MTIDAADHALRAGGVECTLSVAGGPGRGVAAPCGRGRWIEALAADRATRAWLDERLAAFAREHEAFFFEMPAVAPRDDERPARFALLPSSELARMRPDRGSFAEHFRGAGPDAVAAFANLSGDAWLVAPSVHAREPFTHLAAFVRRAPREQRLELWRVVAERARTWLATPTRGRCWISTSGLGVGWLHVRLDARPKYITHAPYRDP